MPQTDKDKYYYYAVTEGRTTAKTIIVIFANPNQRKNQRHLCKLEWGSKISSGVPQRNGQVVSESRRNACQSSSPNGVWENRGTRNRWRNRRNGEPGHTKREHNGWQGRNIQKRSLANLWSKRMPLWNRQNWKIDHINNIKNKKVTSQLHCFQHTKGKKKKLGKRFSAARGCWNIHTHTHTHTHSHTHTHTQERAFSRSKLPRVSGNKMSGRAALRGLARRELLPLPARSMRPVADIKVRGAGARVAAGSDQSPSWRRGLVGAQGHQGFSLIKSCRSWKQYKTCTVYKRNVVKCKLATVISHRGLIDVHCPWPYK